VECQTLGTIAKLGLDLSEEVVGKAFWHDRYWRKSGIAPIG